MIRDIYLQGFQSHTNTHITFADGLTVITGPSDSGKTAVIRALRWLAFNEPTGEAFVNESVGEALVKVVLDNGIIISKTRRKGKTTYILQMGVDDAGSVFEKSEVPEEIKQVLGIEKQTFGDFQTSLNFSFQLEAPFLISEPASAGAKVLGKLAGTEAVDLAVKSVSKDTYAARQERSQAEKEIERFLSQLFLYEGIDEAKQKVEICELIVSDIETLIAKQEKLKTVQEQHNKATKQLEQCTISLEKLKDLPALSSHLIQLENKQELLRSLTEQKNKYDSTTQQKVRCDALVLRYKDTSKIDQLLKDIDKKFGYRLSKMSLQQDYQKNVLVVKNATTILSKTATISAVNERIRSIENDIQHLKQMQNAQQRFMVCEATIFEKEQQLLKMEVVEVVTKEVNSLESFVEKFRLLMPVKQKHQLLKQQLENTKTKVEQLQKLQEIQAIIFKLDALQEKAEQLKTAFREHFFRKELLQRAKKNLVVSTKQVEETQSALDFLWSQTGGVCPLCDQPLENHSH